MLLDAQMRAPRTNLDHSNWNPKRCRWWDRNFHSAFASCLRDSRAQLAAQMRDFKAQSAIQVREENPETFSRLKSTCFLARDSEEVQTKKTAKNGIGKIESKKRKNKLESPTRKKRDICGQTRSNQQRLSFYISATNTLKSDLMTSCSCFSQQNTATIKNEIR